MCESAGKCFSDGGLCFRRREAEKAEETPEISKTEFQETDEEKLEQLKEMVDTFPEEPELWWMDKDELTALYDTFTEICLT